MKKVLGTVIVILLAFAALSMTACGDAELQSRLDELQTKVERLETEKQEQSDKIAALENEEREQLRKIVELYTENKKQSDKIDELEDENKTISDNMGTLENQLEAQNSVFLDLEFAYAKGFLNREELKSIAYYLNSKSAEAGYVPIAKAPETISDETAEAIKLKYFHEYRLRHTKYGQSPYLGLDDVIIGRYFGTYNDCVAVIMKMSLDGSLPATNEVTIDGVTFYYPDSNHFVELWVPEGVYPKYPKEY